MTNDAGRNFNLDGRASSFCACSSLSSQQVPIFQEGFHEEAAWTAGLMFGEENDRPHKYPSCADWTRRVIDYQMAGKRDCRQPTLIRALKQFKVHTWICNMYSSLLILLILMHIKLFTFSYATNHCMNPPSETWKLIQKKLQTSDITLVATHQVLLGTCYHCLLTSNVIK